MAKPCVFCQIIANEAPANIVRRWTDAIAIVPLNPCTDGHVLVIPTIHVQDAGEVPYITGMAAARAAELAGSDAFNLITSAGGEATQTVMHLHWHYVPRSEDDGLALPWTGQEVGRG